MSEKVEHKWVSEGIQPLWKSEGWSIHRRNKTSGKSRGGIIAKGLPEYAAKTLCNDANRGSSCFRCKVVSPNGEIFSLMPQLKDAESEMRDWREVAEHLYAAATGDTSCDAWNAVYAEYEALRVVKG